MKGNSHRRFASGIPHHVYTRAINSNIIFYSIEDVIWALTLYCVLARKYGIIVFAFCPMPNHLHSGEKCKNRDSFISFHRDFESYFATEYNREHHRSGPLFEEQFGYATKWVAKKIRDMFSYIANNPVVGNIVHDFLDFRWNLMAYRDSDHPFSEKIVLKKASLAMRKSLKMLQDFKDKELPLTYARQRLLFNKLSKKEKNQLIDRILSLYNCLDYEELAKFYYEGKYENALISMKTGSGSETDLKEDYEDYSSFERMSQIARSNGVNMRHCNFESAPEALIETLFDTFVTNCFNGRQIAKFLHLKYRGA